MRVLVVDDEEDVRLLLRLQLEGHGHAVTGEAADGAAALASCAEDEPQVVILDLLMPGMNGFETIPALRRVHPKVGIIAYTAVAGDFVRDEMKRMKVPLVLKTASFEPIEAAMRQAVVRA